MADVLLKVEETVIPNIAKAIMDKTGKSEPLTLSQFASEIESISGGSGCGSASLNIHYGDTEPSDTSMLWCKCEEPTNVVINSEIEGVEALNPIVAKLPNRLWGMGVGVVGKNVYIFGGSHLHHNILVSLGSVSP